MATTQAYNAADDVIECQTYTHARRFPLVVGQIGGYYLPVPWTPAQLMVAIGSLLLLLWSRSVWAHFGVVGNVLIVLGLPLLLSWLVRHLRIEGRSTARALAGFARYLARSRSGRMHGRPVARPRAHRHRVALVFATQSAPEVPAAEHLPWDVSAPALPADLLAVARSKGG